VLGESNNGGERRTFVFAVELDLGLHSVVSFLQGRRNVWKLVVSVSLCV